LTISVTTAIFSGELELAGFIEANDDGSGGGDNWSYKTCKAPIKSSLPTSQHPTFYGPDALVGRITQKELNQFTPNSVVSWHRGHGRNH